MEREQDDLQKQLEAQLMGDRPSPMPGEPPMQTQPVGGATPLGTVTGGNTGVAGGANLGTPQQNGGNGIDWRKKMQYGMGPGVLSGFNTSGAGYDEKAANSVKNTFGRIAQKYQANPEGLKQLVNDPDFKRAFPNAKLADSSAGDKIDFGGILSDFESGTPVGVVDVGGAFDPSNNTGQNWWFHPDAEDGMGGGGGGGGVDVASIMGGGTDVNAMINELMSGQDSQTQKIIQEILAGQQPDAPMVP